MQSITSGLGRVEKGEGGRGGDYFSSKLSFFVPEDQPLTTAAAFHAPLSAPPKVILSRRSLCVCARGHMSGKRRESASQRVGNSAAGKFQGCRSRESGRKACRSRSNCVRWGAALRWGWMRRRYRGRPTRAHRRQAGRAHSLFRNLLPEAGPPPTDVGNVASVSVVFTCRE